jgi:hypothetical protein
LQAGCSGDWAADDVDSFELAGSGHGLLLAPMAQTAKPATINRTERTRFTIIRFIIITPRNAELMGIVETTSLVTSFFLAENSPFFFSRGPLFGFLRLDRS